MGVFLRNLEPSEVPDLELHGIYVEVLGKDGPAVVAVCSPELAAEIDDFRALKKSGALAGVGLGDFVSGGPRGPVSTG